MSYAEKWKKAKVNFEVKTKKKKPSEPFMLVFTKGSGIEKNLKSLDQATNKSISHVAVALSDFKKSKESYEKVLKEAAKKDEEAPEYKQALAELLKALEDIYTEAAKDSKSNNLKGVLTLGERVINILDGMPSFTWLDLPPKVNIKIAPKIWYTGPGSNLMSSQSLDHILHPIIEDTRKDLRDLLDTANVAVKEMTYAGQVADMTRFLEEVNKYVWSLEKDLPEKIEKKIQHHVKEMQNRNVDLYVERCELALRCTVSAVKIGVAALKMSAAIPEIFESLITIGKEVKKLAGEIKLLLTSIDTLANSLREQLALMIKKQATGGTKQQLWEAIVDDLKGVETQFNRYRSMTTELNKRSLKLAEEVNRSLDWQEKLKKNAPDCPVNESIERMIFLIQKDQGEFQLYLKIEKELETQLETIKKGEPVLVGFLKKVQELKELKELDGQLEKAAELLIKKVGDWAKK